MIWSVIAALAFGSMGLLALSLRAKTELNNQADSSPAIFADQLAELDRDVARAVFKHRVRKNFIGFNRMHRRGQNNAKRDVGQKAPHDAAPACNAPAALRAARNVATASSSTTGPT